MMAVVSTAPNLNTSSSQGRSWQNPSAPPLLPPETGDNVAALRCQKPSVREVNSRYMSTSSSFSSTSTSSASNSSYRRSASPLPSRTVATGSGTPAGTPLRSSSENRRSQSAERRRPATPTPVKAAIGAQMSATAKAVMSASKRSLSVSFQGESILTPIGKTKPAPPPNSRKSASAAMTPSNGGEHSENARSARSRQVCTEKPMTKSVDLGSDRKKLVTRSGNVVRSLQQSLAERTDQIPSKDKLQDITSNTALLNANLLNLSISASESAASGTESICSQNNSESKDNGNMPQIRAGARGVIVPARFWEETNNRLRRLAEPSSALCRSRSLKATVSSSPSMNLTSRGLSPIRGGVRPASPSRLNAATTPLEKSSSSRTMASPGRVRSGMLSTSGNTVCSVPSVLCFAADVRRGKLGESKISDAHLLRLMYNRNLQWRFANCKVEAALSFQRLNVERNLYNTWKAMSDFRLSVYNWRLEITRMSLKLKLLSILKEQMIYLEKWALLEKDFVSSLLGATESFRVSTIQLPIVCGAMANIINLKGAICSAVDVLQAMASSICSLMSEVEKVNALLDEVVSVATSERALLDECKDFLSTLAAFQVKDCTLRAHVSQLKRAPPSLPIEA